MTGVVTTADDDGTAQALVSPDIVAGTYVVSGRQTVAGTTGPASEDQTVVVPLPSFPVLEVTVAPGVYEPLEVPNPAGYYEYVRVP
jgi:hypothetical protein